MTWCCRTERSVLGSMVTDVKWLSHNNVIVNHILNWLTGWFPVAFEEFIWSFWLSGNFVVGILSYVGTTITHGCLIALPFAGSLGGCLNIWPGGPMFRWLPRAWRVLVHEEPWLIPILNDA